ncbi:MAG: hypothetical protein K8H75_16680 [Sulfuricella sp.]|nr:hypothetical protein [Sulfuricella sp.]
MDHLEALRRKAAAPRAEKNSALISALQELGVSSKAASGAVGVSPTLYSFWKNGLAPVPPKYKPALLDLAREARRVLLDNAHVGANRIKIARAAGFLAEAEVEVSHDEPR